MTENEIGDIIVNRAMAIHRSLGPGLFESVYLKVLAFELRKAGLKVETETPIPICYKDMVIENAFRADLVVENKVIIELKSIENLNNSHKKQLLTYLRLTGLKLGYLFNFSEELLRHGMHRIVNGLNQEWKNLNQTNTSPRNI